jgi:hypothetical protein
MNRDLQRIIMLGSAGGVVFLENEDSPLAITPPIKLELPSKGKRSWVIHPPLAVVYSSAMNSPSAVHQENERVFL